MSRCIKQCLFATTKEISSNSISSKIVKQNAKLLIPNKFPRQKYQDCQPLASPLQLNNPNLPSKMAEHENEPTICLNSRVVCSGLFSSPIEHLSSVPFKYSAMLLELAKDMPES